LLAGQASVGCGVCLAALLLATAVYAQGTVNATGTLDRAEVSVGETIRFWITVANNSDDVADVRIVGVDASGVSYQLNPPCKCADATCFQAATCAPLKAILHRGEQFVFWGDLKPDSWVTKQTAWVVLRWRNAHGRLDEASVALGPITATPWPIVWWNNVVNFVKDIAIPLAVAAFAGLPLLWKWWQRERTKQQQEESERHAEITATWRKMLPVSHQYTIKYYMPVAAVADVAIRYSDKAFAQHGKDDLSNRRAFWVWTLFWRRIRAQIDALNGFYFKDRCGEELVSALLARCQEIYLEARPESRRRLDQILSILEPHGSRSRFGAFEEKWKYESKIGTALGSELDAEFASFVQWLETDDFQVARNVLGAFAAFTRLEMNRVYEPWYGQPEKTSPREGVARAAWEAVAAAASRGAVSEAALIEYLNRNGCTRPPASSS